LKRTINTTINIEEFDTMDDLSSADYDLMRKAEEAAGNAYAPYSAFFVGAALLLENGKIVIGNNQENVAYPSGLCAERVAIFAAGAQYPNERINTIAVTARSTQFKVDYPVSPCGACRQSMAEYENKQKENIRLILKGETGNIYIVESVQSLLPLLFNEEGLKKI
jgi:cytidine deaminase